MELFFKGKEFVYNHHLTIPFRPLIPHVDKSIGEGNLDENLIIQGDNLHALKALLPQYAGKVDCIFIDPPYNTGNESWNYNDNVNSPIMREWLSSNPVNREDMLRHDKWCAMMWPRFKLLHELLAETGSLWMTLDDNEVHRARIMLDEIFGDNFITTIAWTNKVSPANDAEFMSDDYDSIIVVAKNKSQFKINKLERNERQSALYTNPDNDPRGDWNSLTYTSNKSKEERPNLYYGIINPFTMNEIFPQEGTTWRFSPERHIQNERDQLLYWGVDGTARTPRYKRFLHEMEGVVPRNSWSYKDCGSTQSASIEMQQLHLTFPTPKPTKLLSRIIEIATLSDSIILDSFAGSGSTAHAVLEANRKDGGNRRFILVECEDYADTLTAERARRVMNGYSFTGKIKEEILREKLTWTKLQGASNLLHQISGLEALHAPNFDRIKKEIKDGEVIVTGEKDISDTKPGLGGSFTYCTLGEPLDMDALLTGNNLPDYAALGAWVFYTATNQTLTPRAIDPANFYLGESSQYHVWLIYKPDLEFLKSNDSALTLSRAEKIARTHQDKRHLVFAPAKFVPNKALMPLGIEFAQLPYAIYRREQA